MCQLLEDFHKDWFSHPHYWFNGTVHDQYLTETYGSLLGSTTEITNLQQQVATIVVHDQLSAHAKRFAPQLYTQDYRQRSFSLAMEIHHLVANDDNGLLTPEERSFCLLPLRHTQQLVLVSICLHLIKKFRQTVDPPIYQKFHRATLMQLNKLVTPLITQEPQSALPWVQILDPQASQTLPLTAAFQPTPLSQTIYENLRKLELSEAENPVPNRWAISLSGGVDSMVMSLVVHSYCLAKNIELILLHVNYNNRDCCAAEVSMLAAWANFLGRPLYVRHITQIQRTYDKNRAMYEEVTRHARFELYRRFQCPVFVGHNSDDTEENIISNIKKQKNYGNLRGMSIFSTEAEVSIIRPMLDISKTDIYQFANANGIPYFYDSTNPDCERGKHRLKLFPFLNDYDPALVPGLHHLALMTKELYDVQNILAQLLMKSFDLTTKTLDLVNGVEDLGYGFWSNFIYKFVRLLNERAPSHASIQNLTERLNSRQYGYVVITKEFRFLYCSRKDCNILRFVKS